VRQNNGAIVRDSDILVRGQELSIQLGRGQAKVKVIEIDRGKKE
jgi:ribosomal 50S subunit-recycling heat shock protein